MNTNSRIKQLKAEIARLEKADQLRGKLDKVCKKAGFTSLADYLSLTGSPAPTGRKKTRKRLTAEQKAEILEKIKAGAKKTDLAAQYGVHYQTIVKMKA